MERCSQTSLKNQTCQLYSIALECQLHFHQPTLEVSHLQSIQSRENSAGRWNRTVDLASTESDWNNPSSKASVEMENKIKKKKRSFFIPTSNPSSLLSSLPLHREQCLHFCLLALQNFVKWRKVQRILEYFTFVRKPTIMHYLFESSLK